MMKTRLLFSLILSFVTMLPFHAQAAKKSMTIEELKNEIYRILSHRDHSFMKSHTELVEVNFLINARNELVVLDVFGDSEEACEHVKTSLNYRKVKYKQAKQLTRYMIPVRLVKNNSRP